MAKGIDPKFVHYGIRKDDLAMIGLQNIFT